MRSQIRFSIKRFGRTISGPEWAAKCLRVLPFYYMSLVKGKENTAKKKAFKDSYFSICLRFDVYFSLLVASK
jgi:hypothetical protein